MTLCNPNFNGDTFIYFRLLKSEDFCLLPRNMHLTQLEPPRTLMMTTDGTSSAGRAPNAGKDRPSAKAALIGPQS